MNSAKESFDKLNKVIIKKDLCADDFRQFDLNTKLYRRDWVDIAFRVNLPKDASPYATVTELVLLRTCTDTNMPHIIQLLIEAGADMDIIDIYQLYYLLRYLYLLSNSMTPLHVFYNIISAKKQPFQDKTFMVRFLSRYYTCLQTKTNIMKHGLYYLCLEKLLALGQEIDKKFFLYPDVAKNTNNWNFVFLLHCLERKNYFILF